MLTPITGTNNNDSLIGDAEGNDIQGLAGNDQLQGNGGNDSLSGGADHDFLSGGDGDDTLNGGTGNDSLLGDDGSDTYLFAQGDGQDSISEHAPFGTSSNDRLILSGDALSSTNVRIERTHDDAKFIFGGVSDSIHITSQFLFGSPDTHIDSITFSDGVTWDYNTFTREYLARAGSAGNDTITGFSNVSDTLRGGLGNDTLDGLSGNDTFLFAQGDGQDQINDFSGFDQLIFSGDALKSGNVQVIRRPEIITNAGEFITIGFKGLSDSVTFRVVEQDNGAVGPFGVGSVTFADNVSWGLKDLAKAYLATVSTAGNDTIIGFGTDDVITAGLGNDLLNGGQGNNTYIYATGDGQDSLASGTGKNTLVLNGAELGSTKVRIDRTNQGRDAVLSFDGVKDSITLQEHFGNGNAVNTIRFGDNVSWSGDDLRALYLKNATTSGNDTIDGFGGDDIVLGGLGNDILNGQNGNDLYRHAQGDGSDTIWASTGNDTLEFTGAALNSNNVTLTRTVVGTIDELTLHFGGVSDSVALRIDTSQNFAGEGDLITFSDGVIWDRTALRDNYLAQSATNGNDSIYGFETNDVLSGGLGNDLLSGLGGTDTYLYAQGGGHDTVIGYGFSTESLIISGAALSSTNVRLTRTLAFDGNGMPVGANDVTLAFGVNDSVTLQGQFGGFQSGIDSVTFGDSVVWDAATLRAKYFASAATSGNDTVLGFGDIADVISGGLGNDVLAGLGGFDTYLHAQGDGQDTVISQSFSVLEFTGKDLTLDNLILTRVGQSNDVTLGFVGSADTVVLKNQFLDSFRGVSQINFSDGTKLQRDTLLTKYLTGLTTAGDDLIYGTGVVDTISGGLGNDSLNGLGAGDTYLFNKGDGQDTIIELANGGFDTLRVGADLDFANLKINLLQDGSSVELSFTGTTEKITLLDQFGNTAAGVETIHYFRNGFSNSYTRMELARTYLSGLLTNGNDVINGFDFSNENLVLGVGETGAGNDRFDGKGGDDVLYGGEGDDTLIGGSGVDFLDGGSGIDLADYSGATSAVNVRLSSGHASFDGQGRFDFFQSIENLIGGAFDDSLDGDAAANQLNGAAGNDSILGAGGSDTLIGGAGNDRLEGGTGADSADYSGASGAVTAELWRGTAANDCQGGNDVLVGIENLIGGNFNDLLAGDEAANVLDGSGGNDSLFAGGGNDTLQGGVGNDLLAGGAGTDSIHGGSGLDSADYSSATAAVTAELWRGTAANDGQGGSDALTDIESLIGGNFNDLLAGDESANSLNGAGGNDSLFGGGGNDSLIGGNGNDLLAGGAGFDNLNGGAGLDTADYASATTAVTAELWRGTASNDGQGGNDVLTGIDNLNGGNFNDLLAGDEAANNLNGQGGNDSLFAGGGNDSLIGGNGNDLLAGGAGIDNLNGGAGIDTADYGSATGSVTAELWRGTAANDGQGGNDVLLGIENLNGGAFNDLLVGDEAANSINGAAGSDVLFGGGGMDTLFGGNGNDFAAAGAGNDSLDGGSGIDTVDYASATSGVVVELWRNSASNDGQGGADVVLNFENLNGGNFNDFLVGNEGANVIVAGNGMDTVYSGGGDDFINGGNGNDLLVGGAGRDIYRFDSALNGASNLDTITGFVVADDTISLARSIFGSVAAGPLGAGNLHAGAGVTSALEADDFILYNSSTGALYYDADGSGAALAVQFAVLPVGLSLASSNFVVS